MFAFLNKQTFLCHTHTMASRPVSTWWCVTPCGGDLVLGYLIQRGQHSISQIRVLTLGVLESSRLGHLGSLKPEALLQKAVHPRESEGQLEPGQTPSSTKPVAFWYTQGTALCGHHGIGCPFGERGSGCCPVPGISHRCWWDPPQLLINTDRSPTETLINIPNICT